MSKVTGVVESKSRAETGIKVNGQWYNGSKAILADVKWKDSVELEVDSDGKKIISASVTAGGSTAPPQDNKVDWDARQDSILWQSARKDAVALVGVVVAHFPGAIPVPTAKNKQYDAIVGVVEDLTRVMFDRSKNFKEESE